MSSASRATTNRFRAPVLLLCTLCFAAILPLSAASIAIFNTGLNASGSATLTGNGTATGGAADPHWTVTGFGTAFEAQSTSNIAGFTNWPLPSTQNGTPGTGPWIGSSTTGGAAGGYTGANGTAISQWISFQSDIDSEPDTTTQYSYNQTFTLSNFILGTADIQGIYATDNSLTAIFVNGTQVTGYGPGFGTSGVKSTFDINNTNCPGCFVNGTNTITLEVQNTKSGAPNPSGLMVEFSSATYQSGVPEPATLFGVGLGLSVLGLVSRRRRS